MPQPPFSSPGNAASVPCSLSTAPPSWMLGVSLPGGISFPPKFPPFSLNLRFKLSCDPDQPVTITDGVPWGGGRVSNNPPDPDDSEWYTTF